MLHLRDRLEDRARVRVLQPGREALRGEELRDAVADQLRARVAFALSEIVVISNIAPTLPAYALSSWWDTLNRHAFGNYRELLEAVTLHPAMPLPSDRGDFDKTLPGCGPPPGMMGLSHTVGCFRWAFLAGNRPTLHMRKPRNQGCGANQAGQRRG